MVVGSDPLDLQILEVGLHEAAAAPYHGRYPSASLHHDGIWYYGTYCLDDAGRGLNWDVLGPFVGFRTSTDGGASWQEGPHTPTENIFGESALAGQPVRMGAPHFVDFGRNVQHSPDGYAYLLGHGSRNPSANLSWISRDEVTLARVRPSPERIHDAAQWEWAAGRYADGTPRWAATLAQAQPIAAWPGHMGCVTVTYLPARRKYLMCVTDGWPTIQGDALLRPGGRRPARSVADGRLPERVRRPGVLPELPVEVRHRRRQSRLALLLRQLHQSLPRYPVATGSRRQPLRHVPPRTPPAAVSSDPLDLSGQLVLLSGGAGALGTAIVDTLMLHHAEVIVPDPGADEDRTGPQHLAIRADCSDPADVEDVLARCEEHFHRLPDTVGLHAGIVAAHPVQDYPLAEFYRLLRVNVRSAFVLAQAAARRWIQEGQGAPWYSPPPGYRTCRGPVSPPTAPVRPPSAR